MRVLEQSIVIEVGEALRADLDCMHEESALADLVCGRRVPVETARRVRIELAKNEDGMPSWNSEQLIGLIDAELDRAKVEAEKYLKAIGGRLI